MTIDMNKAYEAAYTNSLASLADAANHDEWVKLSRLYQGLADSGEIVPDDQVSTEFNPANPFGFDQPTTLSEALKSMHLAFCRVLEDSFFNRLTRDTAVLIHRCLVYASAEATFNIAESATPDGLYRPLTYSAERFRTTWNEHHADQQKIV